MVKMKLLKMKMKPITLMKRALTMKKALELLQETIIILTTMGSICEDHVQTARVIGLKKK
jgi:hypothetical protein